MVNIDNSTVYMCEEGQRTGTHVACICEKKARELALMLLAYKHK